VSARRLGATTDSSALADLSPGRATIGRVEQGRAGAVLEATLERITFANPQTGYTVARVDTGRGDTLVTVVGSLLGVVLLGMIGPALTFLGVSAYWERAIQGGIILAALVVDSLRSHSGAYGIGVPTSHA